MKAEKAQAQFYEMEVTQNHINQGIVIGAYSSIGSKFKVLLLEQRGAKQWEIQTQASGFVFPKSCL